MLLFRSLALGLLGACCLLLARPRPCQVRIVQQAAPAPLYEVSASTIVDVAPAVALASVPSLLHLAPGERITAVDDRATDDDVTAGALIAQRPRTAGSYIDLSTSSGRRVLVLLH